MNRRNFLGFIGCSCCSVLLYQCESVPITQRKQLRIISEAKLNNQAAQIYLHPYEFVSDMSFYVNWKDMNGLSFFLKLYWLLRQSQWHIVGNKSVMRKLEIIFTNYKCGGKINGI